MLLFLVKHSRPDLANPVRELSKCLDCAGEAAHKEMLRIIKFVLDTKNRGLKVHPVDTGLKWELIVWSDSTWASDKDDRKSVSGFMIFLNGVLICWRAKTQRVVSLSSAEAEFYACSEAVKEIPFIAQILLFLGIPVELPVKVKVDNIGAIFMTENTSSSNRTRHMDTRWHFVNNLQNDDKLIKVEFTPSASNLADGVTKNVTGEIYQSHLDSYAAEKDYLLEDVIKQETPDDSRNKEG